MDNAIRKHFTILSFKDVVPIFLFVFLTGILAFSPNGQSRHTEKYASYDSLILTPKPSAFPRINGAKVFGVRPGHPVLFTIAATGLAGEGTGGTKKFFANPFFCL